jgi:glutathione S-transferase
VKLYGYRNGRTACALWALEEVAATYDYVEVDIPRGEGRSGWFLKLNPAGKVPVLEDSGFVITESAAICLHVADRFPEAKLLPRLGTHERALCYQWVSFAISELEQPLWTIAKHRFVLPLDRRVAKAIDTAQWEFSVAAEVLSEGLAGREYVIGEQFTVADILLGHTLAWARSARVPLGSQDLEAYEDRVLSRPAWDRTREKTRVAAQAKKTASGQASDG